jgi:hypothetical protein
MIGPFLLMEVLCGLAKWSNGWHNWRPGGAIRGKWRILDGKIESGLNHKFRTSRILCRLRTALVGSEWTNIWNVLALIGHMESPNWVASCVDELDDTLPRFMDVQWVSVRATHGVSTEAYAWKTALGQGWTRPGLLITSWIVATRGAYGPACVVLLGLYPCKVDYRFKSPHHPQKWVMACSPHLNIELSTS